MKMKTSTRISAALFALALAVAPAIASAHPIQSVHSRTTTIHDRSPRPHTHESSAHH